jgi:hypothetical protein
MRGASHPVGWKGTHDIAQTPFMHANPSHWPGPVHLRALHVEPLHWLPPLQSESLLHNVPHVPLQRYGAHSASLAH